MTYGVVLDSSGGTIVGQGVPGADEPRRPRPMTPWTVRPLRSDLPDADADEQDGEQQQEGVHRRAATAQLGRVGVAEQDRPAIRPPGRQLPKIMAARPM